MKRDLSLVGLGLYSPAEAAALTHIPAQRIRRWLTGHRIGEKDYPALWHSQLEKFDLDDQLYLSFLDLIQLRLADAFIREGVSAQKVRRAIEFGAKIVASDYPFANAKFRTDGKTILLHVLEPDGDEKLIDLFGHGQYLMQKVIEPSLKNLEFEGDIAARWWPLGRAKGIVIDPQRQFGQPIDDESGIPTSILAQAEKTEGSAAAAAKRFMVPVASIRRAAAFELQQAA